MLTCISDFINYLNVTSPTQEISNLVVNMKKINECHKKKFASAFAISTYPEISDMSIIEQKIKLMVIFCHCFLI